MNSQRLISLANGLYGTDAANLGQLSGYITESNTWTYLASLTLAGSPSSASASITMASSPISAGITLGMSVTGTGIPATGVIVIAISGSGNVITLSQAATSSPGSVTLTFGSNTSQFTVPGNLTSTYVKGMYVSWVQNAITYYGVVYSSSYNNSSTTTVCLIKNEDYAIQNLTVTSAYYSWIKPSGFPTSFSWIPNLSGFSLAPALPQCWWSLNNGLMFFAVWFFNSGTSNATTTTLLNAPMASDGKNTYTWTGLAQDNNISKTVWGTMGTSVTLINFILGYNGSPTWTASGTKNIAITGNYPI